MCAVSTAGLTTTRVWIKWTKCGVVEYYNLDLVGVPVRVYARAAKCNTPVGFIDPQFDVVQCICGGSALRASVLCKL